MLQKIRTWCRGITSSCDDAESVCIQSIASWSVARECLLPEYRVIIQSIHCWEIHLQKVKSWIQYLCQYLSFTALVNWLNLLWNGSVHGWNHHWVQDCLFWHQTTQQWWVLYNDKYHVLEFEIEFFAKHFFSIRKSHFKSIIHQSGSTYFIRVGNTCIW